MAEFITAEVVPVKEEKKVNRIVSIKAQEVGINLDILIETEEDKQLVRDVLSRFGVNDNYLITEQKVYADSSTFLANL
jgi:hypothetical protein